MGPVPNPAVLDEMVKRPFADVLGPPKIFQVLPDLQIKMDPELWQSAQNIAAGGRS